MPSGRRTSPGPARRGRPHIEKFKMVAGRLNLLESTSSRPTALAYHNHDFEFVEQQGDRIRHTPQGNRSGAGEAADGPVRVAHGSKPHRTSGSSGRRAAHVACQGHAQDHRDYTRLGNGSIDFARICLMAGSEMRFCDAGSPTEAEHKWRRTRLSFRCARAPNGRAAEVQRLLPHSLAGHQYP